MEEKFKQKPGNLVKVVLFGPESTGKTTLAKALASHYGTYCVPEYMRKYLQDKWDRTKETCTPEDLIPIAEGQMKLENELSEKAQDLLVCDTNLLELKVYSEAYYGGYCDVRLEKHALTNKYNIYFLTYIDVPWEEDDLRDKPNEGEEMFNRFKATLDKYQFPYVVLKGDFDTRMKVAKQNIDKLFR